jgi:amidase
MRPLSAYCLCILHTGIAIATQDQPSLFGFTPSLFPLEQNVETPSLFPVEKCGGFQLEEATIDQMQAAMENGTLSSVQLVTCYMLRTFQTNSYAK